MSSEWESDPQWIEFVKNVRIDALEKIGGSDAVVSIAPAPGEEADIKYAVELGLSIMLDKPLLVVVAPGRTVPPKLRAVADEIVEADLDLEQGRLAIAEAFARMKGDGETS